MRVDAATWTAAMNGQPMPMPSSPERGIVLHNELRMITDTSMRSQSSPMMPSMQSHGTTTMSAHVIE